jgi:hypothetical protein
MGPYCKFCGSRCFVPVTLKLNLPAKLQATWAAHGYPILATCQTGRELDRSVLGFDYMDRLAKTAGEVLIDG